MYRDCQYIKIFSNYLNLYLSFAVRKVSTANFGLNNMMCRFFIKNNISINAKWSVFNAVCHAIVGYGA